MPIDHYVLSGFANRLTNADVHSFDGLLFILQEYESISESRRTQQELLSTKGKHDSNVDDILSLKGEEYLWSLMKELTELILYEINLQNTINKETAKRDDLAHNYRFLYWSAIQNWLQKMRRKSTVITLFDEPLPSSSLSFNSLFQKSSDKTSTEESCLIRVMYDAFRSGAFDDPSVGSQDDWSTLFNHYSFHWRRCSLQGAVADESIRHSFQEICRSFQSDDPTECLLYSLHTAETLDDLQHVLELQNQMNDGKSSGDAFDDLCDELWCAVTCLLRLFAVAGSGEVLNDFEEAFRPICQRFLELTPLSCHVMGSILLRQEQGIDILNPQEEDVDEQRLRSHVLLVLNSLHGLLAPYVIQPELKAMAFMVDYQSVLIDYLHGLVAQGLTDVPVVYLRFLQDSDILRIFDQITQKCYESYRASDGKLFKPFSSLLRAVQLQKKGLQRLFYQWIIQFCQRDCCASEDEFLRKCKLLLAIMDESRNRAGLLWNAFCDMWNLFIMTNASHFIDVIKKISWVHFSSKMPRSHEWEDSDLCSKQQQFVKADISFYIQYGSTLQRLNQLKADESLVDQLPALITDVMCLLEKRVNDEFALCSCLVSSLLQEVINTLTQMSDGYIALGNEENARSINCCIINTIVHLVSPQSILRPFLSMSLIEFLYCKLEMVSQVYIQEG